jgi:signal transduction histidine kinase
LKQETAAAIAEPDADGASAGSDRQQQPDGGATPWQPPEAELRDPLERALAAERLRNARRINLIRFVGVTFFFSLFVVMGLLLDRRSWQGNLHLFAPYWVVTAALYLAGRRHDGAARLMSLAIALVDMPMVFLLQWATFPTTPVPSAVAGYTLGIYVLLLAIAALSLDQPRIFFTAAVGACCEGLLQLLAQVEVGAVVSTFIVMGIAAVVTAHGSRRMTELIRMVAEDVSKRRHAEEELRLRDEFLSVASHELKTPLTSLQLEVEGLVRRVRLAGHTPIAAESITARLESADAQTGRLARLINQLLDVTRMTAGRLQLDLEEVDLAEVVRTVLEQSRRALDQAGCELQLEAGAPVVGRWDRMRLEQLFTNLMANACKYGAGQPVRVTVKATGTDGELVVRDRGIGIASEDQARIFDRFERAASAREFGGLGLGLWICRRIAVALGGQIGVTSTRGEGSTFTVRLPLGGPPVTPPVAKHVPH